MSEGRLALPGVGRNSQADFEAVVSMLPTQLNAEIEGEAGPSVVPITGWSCPDYVRDETGSWPQAGAYTFTAELPEGYMCDPLPAVRVILGGAQAYSLPVTGDGYSFDPDTGILTISNDNGSMAWQSGGIAREDVKEVEIREGVTVIGDGAFWGCSSLTEVTLPTTLESILAQAFRDCAKLKKVTFPASLTSIRDVAFLNCTSLTEVTLPAGLTFVEGAFSGCTSLKRAAFLGTPTTLGEAMFRNCSSLTEVILPAGLTFLPKYTFEGCTSLKKITLPETLNSIGAGAFWNCSSLTEVNLPAALIAIGTAAFDGCSSLTEIVLPDNLQSLGVRAFGYTGLTTITIPPKVTSVDKWAFLDAKNLKTVIFSGMTAPAFGDEIFYGITPPPTVYVPEGASGYDSLSPVFVRSPVITVQPQSITAEAGSPATFTAAADSWTALSLQWQVDQGSGWNAVTDGIGGDTAAYTIPAVSAGMDGWRYRCVITNIAGTVVTDEVTLTVKVPVDSVTPDEGGTPSDGEQSSSGDRYSGSRSSGGSSSSGGSRTPVYGPQSIYAVTGDRISLTIPRADIQSLADSGKVLELSCDTAGMTFSASALRAVLAAAPASGSITFAAAPADLSAFPDVAAFFGSRPVYDFTISGQDRNGAMARIDVNFPAGSAAIALDYTPSHLEVPGSLFMVCVDGMAWLDKSIYRADGVAGGDVSAKAGGRVLAEAPHVSTYGVAYKPLVPVFTDIAGHWAQKDIEFAAARGLLPGKEHDRFSPDAAMTHGMFAAALGRLAGVSPDRYTWGGFGDDAPVTREQMAVMMANFAVQMGYAAPLAAVPFADSGAVSSSAADRFDPQAYATRAEGAVVLRRFVEAVIDPETIGRWGKDDAGQWPGN